MNLSEQTTTDQTKITDSPTTSYSSSSPKTTITATTTKTTTISMDVPLKSNETVNIFFSNGSIDLELMQTILSTHTEDLTGCLVNCSRNGQCVFNNQGQLICSCFGTYVGSSCQVDLDPCSTSPCLNNGECVKTYNSSTKSYEFTCNCDKFHYGTRCENRVDLCMNNTSCSPHGRCVMNASFVPVCQCFQMYSGDECKIESHSLKSIKRIISTTSMLAIITIVLAYSLVLLSDLHTVVTNPQKLLQRNTQKPPQITQAKTIKLTYNP